MAEPKILIWDIETSHNIAAIFRLFEDYTSHENILQERFVICAAWKWLGEEKVSAVSILDDPKRYAKDPCDDRYVLEELHAVLSEADVIIAHNGDQYDIKFAEGRMLFHGLPALPPIPSIDTLKVAKSRLLLNSNKLDYLGRYLGLGKKIKTSNDLWIGVLKGDRASIKEMVTYNKQDVILLEKVFLKLRPYCANHINRQLLGDGDGCPRCGSAKVQRRGIHKAISRTYQRFQCQACYGWYRAVKPVVERVRSRIL
jgi:hypothetical protein